MRRTLVGNAVLFDGEHEPFEGTCLVEGNKIAWVGPAEATPRTSVGDAYDLEDRFLMPGLISCHLHADNLLFGLPNFLAGGQLARERPPGF